MLNNYFAVLVKDWSNIVEYWKGASDKINWLNWEKKIDGFK